MILKNTKTEINWGALVMNTNKGEITLEHVAIFILLVILLIVILIYTGVLRVQLGTAVKKLMDFIIGT